MILDLIATLGGLIVPPVFDFVKKKFIKSESDTPERTIGALATTKPEAVPGYVEALAKWLDSQVKFFNRDVVGAVSQWVVDLRAAIRPIGVILAFVTLGGMIYLTITSGFSQFDVVPEVLDDMLVGIRLSCETMISSWFGSRFTISK